MEEKLTDVLEQQGLLELQFKAVTFSYEDGKEIGAELAKKGYQIIKDNTRFVKATGKKEAHYITDITMKVADVDEFVALDE